MLYFLIGICITIIWLFIKWTGHENLQFGMSVVIFIIAVGEGFVLIKAWKVLLLLYGVCIGSCLFAIKFPKSPCRTITEINKGFISVMMFSTGLFMTLLELYLIDSVVGELGIQSLF